MPASNVSEKLQEKNRTSLEAVHKTQKEVIYYLQKQLLEKDQMIKILEERLRCVSNNRQKEVTIKHLELQIQRLIKENKELDLQIICKRCENKLLCVGDRKAVSKPLVKKNAKDLAVKSSTNRQIDDNMLQRIIEHKDKRIEHLSKEIQKLTQTEIKLTEKIHRLTKLLPMSQIPSEMVTERLLSDIKSSETQIQLPKGIGEVHASNPKLLSFKEIGIHNASCAEKERLQGMLKSSRDLNSQYKEENASLKADLKTLNERLAQEQKRLEEEERRGRKCSEEFRRLDGDFRNEVQLLKAQLKDKQGQLDSTKIHQQLKSLERKLDVAEKNIKGYEELIEELQKVIRNQEEENSKLDSDLHLAKLSKVVSDANANHYVSLKTKLEETEHRLMTVMSNNQNLQNKLALLEEKNANLQTDLNTCNNTLSRCYSEETSLRAKLETAEGTIRVLLENNLVQLQTSVEQLKEENSQLKIRSSKNEKNLILCQDVSFFRNQAFLKDEEIKRLKESLETFERKVFEFNHYRKALRQKISMLCNALTGNGKENSSPNWQAIYNDVILRSAQAILRLDDDCPPRTDENNNDALEEMKLQVPVYQDPEEAEILEMLKLLD